MNKTPEPNNRAERRALKYNHRAVVVPVARNVKGPRSNKDKKAGFIAHK